MPLWNIIILLLLLLMVIVGKADVRAFKHRIEPMKPTQFRAFLQSHDRIIAMRFGGSLYLELRDKQRARRAQHKEM